MQIRYTSVLFISSFCAHFLIESVSCIKCFVCSRQSPTLGCPTRNHAADLWAANSNHYYDVQASNQVIACILGYSTELAVQNQVFYQVIKVALAAVNLHVW